MFFIYLNVKYHKISYGYVSPNEPYSGTQDFIDTTQGIVMHIRQDNASEKIYAAKYFGSSWDLEAYDKLLYDMTLTAGTPLPYNSWVSSSQGFVVDQVSPINVGGNQYLRHFKLLNSSGGIYSYIDGIGGLEGFVQVFSGHLISFENSSFSYTP